MRRGVKLTSVRNTVSPNAYAVEFDRRGSAWWSSLGNRSSLWGPYRRDHSTYITEIWNMHNARDAITSMVITNPNGGKACRSGLAFEENISLTLNPFFLVCLRAWGGQINFNASCNDDLVARAGRWGALTHCRCRCHVGACLNKTYSVKLHWVLCQKYWTRVTMFGVLVDIHLSCVMQEETEELLTSVRRYWTNSWFFHDVNLWGGVFLGASFGACAEFGHSFGLWTRFVSLL